MGAFNNSLKTNQLVERITRDLEILCADALSTRATAEEAWEALQPILGPLERLLGAKAEQPTPASKQTELSMSEILDGLPEALRLRKDLKGVGAGDRMAQLLCSQATLRDLAVALIVRLDLFQSHR